MNKATVNRKYLQDIKRDAPYLKALEVYKKSNDKLIANVKSGYNTSTIDTSGESLSVSLIHEITKEIVALAEKDDLFIISSIEYDSLDNPYLEVRLSMYPFPEKTRFQKILSKIFG